MPELRQDPFTRSWVIVAPQRAARPNQLRPHQALATPQPRFDPACPFCPGREAETPPEL